MRKYRNGKKSQRLQGDNKYSESYLEYSHARGSRSVKSIVFDTDGNGDVDTILKAWRHPAVRKGNYFDSSTDQPTLPLGAEHAPTNISLIVPPESAPTGISVTAPPQVAPTGISVTASPQFAPTGISAVIKLTEGPTGISAVTSPQVAPTGITLNLDRDRDGVYADADFDDNDDQVGSLIPPTSPPTGISALPSPQVAPTGISATEENYSYISFEGQTYDLIEEASNGITVTTTGGNITASRVNDEGEILIPISANSLWGSTNDRTLYGPVLNFKQSDPDEHYVGISCTSSGNTNIITQNLGSANFQNGIASRAINKTWAHELNIISGSITRSKTVIELRWRTLQNDDIKVEYYKIGFQQLIDPPQVAPTGISVLSSPQVAPTGISADIDSTILIYHGMGGVLDSSSRNQTNVPTDGSVWTDISASNWDGGLHYNPHIIVPTFPNAVQYVLTLTNDTTSNNPGLFNRTSSIHPAGGPAPTYTFFDNKNTVAKLTGRTVIRINWYDSNGNTVANEALLRITLV